MSDVEELYVELVARAYEGEVFGAALFAGLVEGRHDQDERRKLKCLRDLEIHTRARVTPLIQRYSIRVDEDRARARADKAIAASTNIGWAQFLAQFDAVTNRALADYRQQLELAPIEERDVARVLIEHEEALQQFARAELQGQTDASLDPIKRILKTD
jgi:hypothetical protein